MPKAALRRLFFASFATLVVRVALSQQLLITPYNPSGIYELRELAGWKVALSERANPAAKYSYSVKKNNFELLKKGMLDFYSGETKIELRLNEPAMLYCEIMAEDDSKNRK